MKSSFLPFALLATLGASIPLVSRAGGPGLVPIPANCTQTNPLPGNTGPGTVSGYKPTDAFVTANLVYSAYYPLSGDPATLAQNCDEQCYGLGGAGSNTCVSVFFAFNVPAPSEYGAPGGQSEDACLLFGADLTADDFEEAPTGTYTNASADDISCPSS